MIIYKKKKLNYRFLFSPGKSNPDCCIHILLAQFVSGPALENQTKPNIQRASYAYSYRVVVNGKIY